MTVSFVRQLGAEAGVQLNPLRDGSEIPVQDNYDQVIGIMMRATRGRIDKPFKVHRGNVYKKLGRGEPVRTNALNEAWIHVVEAVNSGAYEVVVQRLVPETAVIKYAVADVPSPGMGGQVTATITTGSVTALSITTPGTGYTTAPNIVISGGGGSGATATCAVTAGAITSVTLTSGGSGYTSAPTVSVVPVAVHAFDWSVSTTLPAGFDIAIKHLDCHNDGVQFELHSDEIKYGGVAQPTKVVTLRVRDKEGFLLHEFTGSLDPLAKDDFGNAAYLPEVVASQTDSLQVEIGATFTQVEITSNMYGYDADGRQKWASSGYLNCFDEGGHAYTVQDYQKARVLLQNTPHNYAYISSGGSRSPAMLFQLAQLAFDTNRMLRFDIPGSLTPEAAIAFVEQLNMGASPTAHLMHAFWSPLRTDDPTGINGKGYFGVATLNSALSCLRNAQTNAKGFAPKNFPTAGKYNPIRRTGIRQMYDVSQQELNELARAQINPVIHSTFSGGGRYVFLDSLTSEKVESSLKKLIAVSDMSTSIDDAVTRFGKDVLQLPMAVATRRMKDYLKQLFEGAEASGWLVPSSDPIMEGRHSALKCSRTKCALMTAWT